MSKVSTQVDDGEKLMVAGLAVLVAFGLLSLPAYAAIWLTSLLIGFHAVPLGHLSFAVGIELFASRAALLKHWPAAQRSHIYPLPAEIVTIAMLAGAVWLVLWVRSKGLAGLGLQLPRLPFGAKMKNEEGFATRGAIDKHLSRDAAAKKAKFVRPDIAHDLARRRPSTYAYFLGREKASKTELHASLEDTVLVIGPPRSGKGVFLVNNFVAEAPGPVIATSTRPDTLKITAPWRRHVGTCYVFDPQGTESYAGLPVQTLRWDPVKGCADPLKALTRASSFASAAGLGEEGNGKYFEQAAATVLKAYLMAADLSGGNIKDVLAWIGAPDSKQPNGILTAAGGEYIAVANELRSAQGDEPRLRSNVYSTARQALASISDPRVRDACCPLPEESFDVHRFLTEKRNTLYLIGSTTAQASVGPLVVALIEDITEEARKLAAKQPGSRLVPPLLLILDEVANIAPIKKLPGLLSDGSGSGICTVTVFQSMAQARQKWTDHGGQAIYEASACKVILGGLSNARDLEDTSAVLGEVQVRRSSTSRSKKDVTINDSWNSERVLKVAGVREIPFGEALILHRAAPPVRATLEAYDHRWWYNAKKPANAKPKSAAKPQTATKPI